MLKINGTLIPTPSDYGVGIMDISKAERNAAGTMIIERIATKRKIEVVYKYLSQSELSTLLAAVATVSFTLEYRDPQTGTAKTGSFYCGDRKCGAIDYKAGVTRWKDISFSLIER